MTDAIDELLDSLEKMIDAQDDMWEEEKYSNYREVMAIRTDRYLPAKQAARDSIHRVISEIVQQQLAQHTVSIK